VALETLYASESKAKSDREFSLFIEKSYENSVSMKEFSEFFVDR
jgi:hypothetical protein